LKALRSVVFKRGLQRDRFRKVFHFCFGPGTLVRDSWKRSFTRVARLFVRRLFSTMSAKVKFGVKGGPSL
jgi:hypothetical protein